MPAALLFDLDGTLVDSALDIAAALSALRVRRGGGTIGAVMVRPLVSLGAGALVAGALGPHGGDAAADLAEFRRELAAATPSRDAVYPGVREALQELRAAGHRLAIVTNKPEGLSRILLRALALDAPFDVIVGGDTLPVCKPDPAPLAHAMRLLGASAQASLFVGDSMVDARAAAAAALPFLLFDGGYGGVDPATIAVAARFDRFAQLPELVGSVAARGDLRLVL